MVILNIFGFAAAYYPHLCKNFTLFYCSIIKSKAGGLLNPHTESPAKSFHLDDVPGHPEVPHSPTVDIGVGGGLWEDPEAQLPGRSTTCQISTRTHSPRSFPSWETGTLT